MLPREIASAGKARHGGVAEGRPTGLAPMGEGRSQGLALGREHAPTGAHLQGPPGEDARLHTATRRREEDEKERARGRTNSSPTSSSMTRCRKEEGGR